MSVQLPGFIPGRPKTAKLASAWPLLALLCATGLVAFRYIPQMSDRISHIEVAPPQAFNGSVAEPAVPLHDRDGRLPAIRLPFAETEDLLRHLDIASADLKEAAAESQRSQNWTNHALRSLDDDSLTTRRLQIASATSRAAEDRLRHTCEELEIAKRILIERSKEP